MDASHFSMLREEVRHGIPEGGPPHREADESRDRRRSLEPCHHLLLIGAAPQHNAADAVPTTAARSCHHAFAVLAAIEALQDEGRTICGVVSVLDRLAGGAAAIEAAASAPYVPLTTIDEVYPERPDRNGAA